MTRLDWSKYQSEKDEKELDHIRIGHRIEAAEKCVKDGDQSRQDDADVDVDVNDDADSRSYIDSDERKK